MKKKIISTMLSVAMFASFVPSVMAETNETTNSIWNYSLIESGSEVLYESFPFIVDSTRRNNMGMDLYFQYLKNISDDSSVNVKITDTSNDSIVINKTLSNGDLSVYFSEIPNEKIYLVEVTENLDGQVKNYTKYIETKFLPADFPVNMTLGDTVINNNFGEEFTHIMYRKIEETQEEIIEETETAVEIEGIEEENVSSQTNVVDATEINSFYNDLDTNSYYELQVQTDDNRYYGYISTYPNGDDMGVVTRGYEMRDSLAVAGIYSLDNSLSVISNTNTIPSYVTNNAVEYNRYRNEYINFEGSNYEKVYRFVYPETGEYTFETIGNADTTMLIYHKINGVYDGYVGRDTNSGTGNNAKRSYEWLVEEDHIVEAYIYIEWMDGETDAAFRVVRNDYENVDDHTNYFDEIRSQTALGQYSNITNSSRLNYHGDVDLYAYNVNSGYGYVEIVNIDDFWTNQVIAANIYQEGTDPNHDYDTNWWYDSASSANVMSEPNRVDFDEGVYYFEVLQNINSMPLYGNEPDIDDEGNTINPETRPNYFEDYICLYNFNFYDSKHKDTLDATSTTNSGNNVPIYATEIPFTATSEWNNLTLHKGDSDYFKFTTGSSGGNVIVTVDCNDMPSLYNFAYIPHLYDGEVIQCVIRENGTISTSNIVDMASYTTVGRKNILTYDNLAPNHTYYIRTTRPSNTQYSSYYPYKLKVEFEVFDVPSAILENNVSLSHTVGSNITSTDAFLTTVMQNLTCKINGVDVADATAQADVQLYYNNNVLTADMVNVMNAGTYNIVAKYQGVEATGGTITLTVTEPVSDSNILEISGVVNQRVSSVKDWAAAAKLIANIRLNREGETLSTMDITELATTIKPDGGRGDTEDVASAANYVYAQALGLTETCDDFREFGIDQYSLRDDIEYYIGEGSALILQLVNNTAPTDMSNARYIVVIGINLDTDEVKVVDPSKNNNGTWVALSTLINGGYNGNTNLVYNGTVIEYQL